MKPLVLAISLATATACTRPTPARVTPSEPVAAEPTPEAELRAPLIEGLVSQHRDVGTEVPLAQRFFDQGLLLHYGFNHAEAARSFAEAARLDPGCAVCFAGVALTLGPNINSPMDPANNARAVAAIAKAQAIAGRATPADRRLIAALATRYRADPPADRSPLDRAYAEALAAAYRADSRDDDIRALYAEALMILHPWDYWHDGKPRSWTPLILALLQGGLERSPDHAFFNHLYIHAVEASPHPERALPSARRLETLAPGAGHLVHMPAHVYIRIGDYARASMANERAIASDEAYLGQVKAQGAYPLAYYPHNYHFLWATSLLEGRAERSIEAARALAARADRSKMSTPGFGTLQHYYAIPYYALVAFGRWDEILAEPRPALDYLYPTAVWHYARGMAHAARGELELAQRHLVAVVDAASSPSLDDVTIWDLNKTADLVRIAAALLGSEIARKRGNFGDAIGHLERAVALEDSLSYDEPPPWGPATRRYLGAVLLEARDFERAERTFREDLERFPKNGWALFGLLQSLRARGDTERARAVEVRLSRAWSRADTVLTAPRM